MRDLRLTEYENGSIGIYHGTTYKIVLEKHEVEALKLHFGSALPTEPGNYLDADLEPWTLTKIEEENNMTKINLSTGVESTLHGNGDVTLPGDYKTNTSCVEASSVPWERAHNPGIYGDEDGDLWVLTPGGDWLYEVGNQGLQNSGDSAPPYEYYTLTPIKPESF